MMPAHARLVTMTKNPNESHQYGLGGFCSGGQVSSDVEQEKMGMSSLICLKYLFHCTFHCM